MATSGDSEPHLDGPMRLAGLLRAARGRALLTQEELAERAGLSVRAVRNLEAGRVAQPRSASVRLLADALGLTAKERAALIAAVRGVPSMPTPTAPSQPPPAQLPADIGGFTGRDDQLKQLDELLPGEEGAWPGAVVISAIAGTAGVGKTALAVHWAHRVAGRFPDGQLYLNLDGYAPRPAVRPIQALAQLLRSLGAPADTIPVEVEEAAGLYRTLLAGRRLLVVLDNARDAEQVRPLLPGHPGCVVLVTSRDRLTGLVASHGAHRVTIDVLAPAEAVRLLGRVLGEDRVAAEAEATEELARLCAHLPLALRIAGANLADQPQRGAQRPIAGYVAELRAGDRLASLQIDGDEHSAVRATFDLSYQRLPPPARRLFRLLGLLPDPDITADAAAALAGTTPQQAAGLLRRLAAAHLLDEHTAGRFARHDLLCHYAADRARREDHERDQDAAIGRLFDWYLRSAHAAMRLLYPGMLRLALPRPDPPSPQASFGDARQALAWLDAERPNLLATVRHAAGHGPHPAAWLLADALRGYLWLRGATVDWLAAAQTALSAAEAAGDVLAQAAAHLSLAQADRFQGRLDQAVERHLRALTLARQAGWLDGQAALLGNLGNVHHEAGRLEEAVDHHTRSLELHRQLGRVATQAINLGNLGRVFYDQGRLKHSADHHTQALALCQASGFRSHEVIELARLGVAAHALGRFDDALDHLDQALSLARELSARRYEAGVLHVIAEVHRDAGRPAQALGLADHAVALAVEVGDRRFEAGARNAQATIHQHRGDHLAALDGHEQALRLARDTQASYAEVVALIGLAVAHRHLDHLDHARDRIQQALTLACRAGYRVLEGQARTILADLSLTEGDTDRAAEQARQAVDIQRATGHRLGHARALLVLGHALHTSQGPEAALPCWTEAFTRFHELGSPEASEIRTLLDPYRAAGQGSEVSSAAGDPK